jgi:hypothetical protein
MLFYEQPTGEMFRPDHTLIGVGGAGHGAGWNAPELQTAKGVGPLPRGVYRIGDVIMKHEHLGRYVLPLFPLDDPRKTGVAARAWLFGRSAFFIHGWNTDPAKRASSSDGCILLPPNARVRIDLERFTMLAVGLSFPTQVEPEDLSKDDLLMAFELVLPEVVS